MSKRAPRFLGLLGILLIGACAAPRASDDDPSPTTPSDMPAGDTGEPRESSELVDEVQEPLGDGRPPMTLAGTLCSYAAGYLLVAGCGEANRACASGSTTFDMAG